MGELNLQNIRMKCDSKEALHRDSNPAKEYPTRKKAKTRIDTGEERLFLEIPPFSKQDPPKYPPKIPGFHDTAFDGAGHNIVDSIELFCSAGRYGKVKNRYLAERVGFEPTVLVQVHTLSKRAP